MHLIYTDWQLTSVVSTQKSFLEPILVMVNNDIDHPHISVH